MNSPAKDVALYLVAAGIGAFGGDLDWCLNYGAEPDAPANAITIYDTGGAEPDTDQLDMRPSFQVRVRCTSYDDGFAKQQTIRDLLILPAPVIMTTSEFVGISMMSDILSIGRDDTGRFLLTANYNGIRVNKTTES